MPAQTATTLERMNLSSAEANEETPRGIIAQGARMGKRAEEHHPSQNTRSSDQRDVPGRTGKVQNRSVATEQPCLVAQIESQEESSSSAIR